MIDISKQETLVCQKFIELSKYVYCKFHLFQAWMRYLKRFEEGDRNLIFKYLKNLCMSINDDEYKNRYSKFIDKTSGIKKINQFIDYFESNYSKNYMNWTMINRNKIYLLFNTNNITEAFIKFLESKIKVAQKRMDILLESIFFSFKTKSILACLYKKNSATYKIYNKSMNDGEVIYKFFGVSQTNSHNHFKVIKEDDIYNLEEVNNLKTYLIFFDGSMMICNCGHFNFSNKICKHVFAVIFEVSEIYKIPISTSNTRTPFKLIDKVQSYFIDEKIKLNIKKKLIMF